MDGSVNEAPKSAVSISDIFLQFISSYGWPIIFFLVIANLIYSHFRPKIQKWKNDKHDQKLAEEYRLNPERVLAMQEAMILSRLNMQEQQDKLSKERQEKKKQMEEEKRQEKIKKWQCVQKGSSYTNKSNSSESGIPDSSKASSSESLLRDQGYNPLMGSSNGASYRPSRRSGGNSGGG